jgi:Tol biopolymer transport system component
MPFGRPLPLRLLLVLALLLAFVTATAFYFGTQKRLPAPYGPADNGQLVYAAEGGLYARDSLGSNARLILGSAGELGGVVVSPDGQLIAYDNFDDADERGNPREWVANLDGSNPRRVLERGYTFETFEWAPDSRSIAIVTKPRDVPELWIAPADGSGAKQLEFATFVPWGATWDPLRPGVLPVRGQDRETHMTDLYFVTVDGQLLQRLGLRPLNLNGPEFELTGMTFSPDGQTIAYNAIVAEEHPINRHRAHLVGRDGTGNRPLPAPLETNFSQAWPSFAPDGTSILLDTWETKADGSVVHRLAIAPADGSAPARFIGPVIDDANLLKAWSPDGTRILRCACEKKELYSVDPLSGDTEKLAWSGDLPGWQRLAR